MPPPDAAVSSADAWVQLPDGRPHEACTLAASNASVSGAAFNQPLAFAYAFAGEYSGDCGGSRVQFTNAADLAVNPAPVPFLSFGLDPNPSGDYVGTRQVEAYLDLDLQSESIRVEGTVTIDAFDSPGDPQRLVGTINIVTPNIQFSGTFDAGYCKSLDLGCI